VEGAGGGRREAEEKGGGTKHKADSAVVCFRWLGCSARCA
jgi:hypothetical protein